MLIFDGDCGFCTSSARWIEDRLPTGTPVVPWQMLNIETLGLTEADVSTAAYWVDDDGTLHRGHRGIGRALQTMGRLWVVIGRLMVTPPISWLAKPVYALVARFRYMLPGSTDACKLPT